MVALGVVVSTLSADEPLVSPVPPAAEGTPVPVVQEWSGHYSAQETAGRVVVRDAQAWARLWGSLQGHVVPKPEAPKVDFQKHMVIAAMMGTKPTGGYAVRITSVVENEKIVVSVREQSPGPDDMVTMALTSPYQAVVVARSEKPVEFVSVGLEPQPRRRLPRPRAN